MIEGEYVLKRLALALAAVVSLFAAFVPTSAHATPARSYGINFTQRFNGVRGTVPAGPWVIDNKVIRNDNVACYVNDGKHVYEDGHGHLVIKATYNPGGTPCGAGRVYESGALTTSQSLFKYGVVKSRIQVPCHSGVNGTWPAFWGDGAGWPNGGEIDYLEMMRFQPGMAAQHLHGGPLVNNAAWSLGGAAKHIACNSWHVYGAIWSPRSIQFTIDGKVYFTFTPGDLKPGQVWPFDSATESLRYDMAIGGCCGGTPVPSAYPQKMLIDNVFIRTWHGVQPRH